MAIKLATWNINSVRLRMPLVEHFATRFQPDVICLQETKCRDGEFPSSDFRRLGYEHLAINGQKGYHGVCIASRLPFAAIDKREFCEKGDARHVAVTFAAGAAGRDPITVHNFYVPAGGDEPDPIANPKFAHKLAFLDEMTEWLGGDLAQGHAIVVGDLNVAPLENDVWSHKAMLKIVSHTPIETEKLNGVMRAGPWVDAMRRFVPEQERLFTWWSYRSADWENANKGRRLDHVWATTRLADSIRGMEVVKEARGWERPSDHVPVLVQIDH